ncbi:hypothetical protein E4Q23_07710 [Candidatus Accumulibacter phosphatis]|uniref:Uncharacterized protein n=1 Tax=Candidatus Accumulibacter phosphatis TaxID=327160 RepID=A0ABX1TW28_9PROT|nr:hypothetical protein [Candidatus Accumulibacter phosphatis]NMQ27650.1 hypothetical protein [Candidatus Accumulibacter phosphatis]
MKLVIATGCPYTGWEMVVPTLADAGLEAADDAVSGWQDQLLATSSVADPLQLRQALQPDMSMQEALASLLTDDDPDSERLVVNRCPWLLDFWAARYPDAQFLLFFTRAETALAQALMCGIEPFQFIKDWEVNTRHLIRFQRRYRQRALLLSAESANENPHTLAETTRTIGLALNVATESVGREPPSSGETERFLARRLVTDNPSIGALESELDARAQPLGDLPPRASEVALDALLKCYLQTRQDRDQLRSKLDLVQCEFERVVLEKQTVEGIHAATGAQLEEFKARALKLERAGEELEGSNRSLQVSKREALEENGLLLIQLHEVQEELEKVFLEKQQLEQAQAATGVELQQILARMALIEKARQEGEISNQTLEASKREALEENGLLLDTTARGAGKTGEGILEKQQLEQAQAATGAELQQMLARMALIEKARQEGDVNNQTIEASKREALEENELLLEQLHQVQEELEFYFLKYQETLTRENPVPDEKSPEVEESTELARELQLKAPEKKAAAWTNQKFLRTLVRPFRRPDRKKEKLRRQVEVLNRSGLFDKEWYLAEYPDVISGRIDPAEHYLRFGTAEGRNPSPMFDTRYYLQSNPDVAAAGVNPLVHYIEFGISEGRQACG